LDCPDGELSILIVDDLCIAELNQEYLQRKGATNVIAFPMQEGEHAHINPDLLGDVVISMDTTSTEAQDAGLPLTERFDQLLIHGILHLFGYDHIHDEKEAAEMDARANELAALLGHRQKPD